jgi:hypothetical protein
MTRLNFILLSLFLLCYNANISQIALTDLAHQIACAVPRSAISCMLHIVFGPYLVKRLHWHCPIEGDDFNIKCIIKQVRNIFTAPTSGEH